MPTISRGQRGFGGYVYEQTITFSTRSKRFRVNLPEQCREALGLQYLEDESLAGLEKKLLAQSQAYLKMVSKERKVILYKIEMRIDTDGFQRDTLSFCDGLGIAAYAGVFVETEYEGAAQASKIRRFKEVESTLPEALTCRHHNYDPDLAKWKCIDWTPEREEFFRRLGEAMTELCRRADAFFADEQKMLERIASGSRILPFEVAGPTDGREVGERLLSFLKGARDEQV